MAIEPLSFTLAINRVLSPITTNGLTRKEVPFLELLFGLKFNSDLKWNT